MAEAQQASGMPGFLASDGNGSGRLCRQEVLSLAHPMGTSDCEDPSSPEEAPGRASLPSASCGTEPGRRRSAVWPQEEPLVGLDDDPGQGIEQQGPGYMEEVDPALAQQVHLPDT